MKARRFLAVVLALSLLLLGLGAGAWWLLWQRSPLQLQHRALVVPRAARFVPRDAALSLHLLVDGQQPLDYARAVAPVRQRRQASEALARLRDGAFAAAGLDYSNDLAGWLGPETGLWLLQGAQPGQSGWVLALSSRDGDGARRFLQRFWQTRSLAGSGLQISSYRGMGLISGRGALVGQEPAPLATALIDDDLVLLASGRGVLEQALDVSQIDELNQAADPRFRQALQRFEQGTLLLSARPRDLGGVWSDLAGLNSGALVAALRPEGRSLVFDALLEPPLAAAVAVDIAAAGADAPAGVADAPLPAAQAPVQTLPLVASEPLLEALRGSASGLALLQDPAHWPATWPDLLQPWLAAQDEQPAVVPALLRSSTAGPLLWSRSDDGWLMATAADQPPLEQLEPAFAAAALVAAPLDLEGEPVQVWTSFEASGRGRSAGRRGEQLQVNLAAARSLQDGYAWWSDALPALLEQRRGHERPRALLARLQATALPPADPLPGGQPPVSLRWALERQPAQVLLQRSSAWQLLSALASEPLAAPVQGLALAAQPEAAGLRLQARLDLGS